MSVEHRLQPRLLVGREWHGPTLPKVDMGVDDFRERGPMASRPVVHGMHADKAFRCPGDELADEVQVVANEDFVFVGGMFFQCEVGVIGAFSVGLADIERAKERSRGFLEQVGIASDTQMSVPIGPIRRHGFGKG